MRRSLASLAVLLLAFAGCGGGGSTGQPAPPTATTPTPTAPPGQTIAQSCAGQITAMPAVAGPAPAPPPAGITVPSGFTISVIANVPSPRELAFAPNGDLFVGTSGSSVYIVPAADGTANAGAAHVFADLGDTFASGVTFVQSNCSLYAASQFHVYRIAYTVGDQSAKSAPVQIASVRPGGSSDHTTTSLAFTNNMLYASVGSSCNACTETDPTRATIQQMDPSGNGMTARAVHIRNAIALAVNPATGSLWAGVAGQDDLPVGHPYEYFDPVSAHAGVADYGWPNCEENRQAYVAGADCSAVVMPRVEFPAYQTLIGATFYPLASSGAYAFPASYRGGAFVTMHGSWHTDASGHPTAFPRVAFVAISGDSPATPVNWSDPTVQWSEFAGGFQDPTSGNRVGRPTGIAVGPQGDLFVSDDQTGNIYRIRP